MSHGIYQWTLRFLLLPQSLLLLVSAYDAQPRWGQATALITDSLFVYGGKIDQFNQFSYTAAPNVNDVLLLSLSSSFSAASPPWELVSSSTNQSTSQGPALAWSTLSAFNNTGILLFGGQYGTNSTSSNGSAGLLDVYSRIDPQWILQVSGSSSQPPARMRHSSATTISGLVFIFGGERTDGSNIAFSDHFYAAPDTLEFALLPTNNAPPDIYGHASIILSDGRILVFGGYSPSQGSLLPFSTIWILDTTQSTLAWSVITTATTSLPSPRVAFAAALIEGGKIIIHGGSDAAFQTNFPDGWVLDTTQNPMTWTVVEGLSQLGGRRDHLAVPSGGQVIFGFGYADNGPAPASLQIFNVSSGSFIPTFASSNVTTIPTQTLPPATQTSHVITPTSYTSSHSVHPTSTASPGSSGDGRDGTTPSGDRDVSTGTTAIAVGSSLGALGLVVVGLGAAYYIRKRRRNHQFERRFMALHGDDDDGSQSPHFEGGIPEAAPHKAEEPHGPHKLLSSLGIAGALSAAARMRSVRSAAAHRRDMLADEDERSFGEWYNARRRDGTGGSSWSLRSILGGNRLRSRDASVTSHGTGGLPMPWREKSDPFSDGASLMRDEETGFIGAAAYGTSRPRPRRDPSHASYASSMSGTTGYRDPFVDPIHEEPSLPFEPVDLYNEHFDEDAEDVDYDAIQASVRYVPPLAPLRTVMPPLSQQQGHLLSPLSEHTSQSTLPLQTFSSSGSSNGHSGENTFSPLTGNSTSQATSLASVNPPSIPGSPPMKSTSIIGAADSMLLTGNKPMRRSDSWWAKFSRTSLLDHRSNDPPRTTRYDIRDPTPAPRLGAIEEASIRSPEASEKHSPSSAGTDKPMQSQKVSPQSQTPLSRANSVLAKMYGGGAGHGKSMSSLRTADSEAIERMAGMMDVTQRVKSRNHWESGSTSSGGGLSIDTHGSVSDVGDNASLKGNTVEPEPAAEDTMLFASPVDEAETPRALHAAGPSQLPSPPPVDQAMAKSTVMPILDSGKKSKVSERIQEYERRMSLGEPTSPPPTNTKHREERIKKRVEVDYGLVPRPSLFVANPDHRLSRTSDS